MLKTVGASGQLSLGKKLAGRHFEIEQRADGSIVLAPVAIARTARKADVARTAKGGPRFHVFKVDRFDLPSREKRHQRGTVR